MLNRHLLAASAVLRSAATKHAAPSAVLRSVRCNTAIKASQASPVSIRYFSQTYSVRNAAEATASTSEDSDDVPPTDSSLPQSTDPDAPNFVLPEGHTLRRTSKGELKVRPPKDSTFASLKGSMNYDIWKALTSEPFNYTNMSTVQENVLHLLPDLASSIGADAEPMPDGLGRDLLVKARTGTGKTIAFLVPALEARLKSFVDTRRGQFTKPWQSMLDRHKAGFDYAGLDKHGRDNLVRQFANNTVGVLILSPTRELATQISAEAKKLLTHEDSMRVQELVGGVNRSRQIDDWRRSRPDVVVATPGRLLDLLNDVGMIREAMSACRTLVFDEADTLLEMGFRDDIQAILKFLPAKEDRQNMMFSATVSKEIQEVARASLERNHRFIDCVPAGEDNVHKHIPQYATVLDTAAEQFPHILRLIAHDQLTNVGKSKVIVFAPTTKMTQLIAQILRDARKHLPTGRGSEVYEIHSKKDQSSRFNTSDRFRKDTSGASILVTSDVSARGVDYPGTTRVIQVGIPSSKDQYIHRIGRTGRAGASGRSDIVLMNWERGFVHFNLDDLPVKELSCDALSEEVQELCQRFDASPQEFQVRTQAPSVAAGRRQGKQSDRPRGQVGPHGPLSDKYLTSTQTPMLQDSLARLEPDEVKDVFSSLLGFYIARTNELRISKGAILEGLKKWAVESAGLDQPPHIGTTFLRKLGISGDSLGGRSSGGFGGGRPSFSRGGSDRGGSSYGGGRDFGGRESRGAPRSFGGSRPPREGGFSRGGEGVYSRGGEGGFSRGGEGGFSRGGEGGFSRGGEGGFSRGGEGGFSRGGDRSSRGSSGPSKRW